MVSRYSTTRKPLRLRRLFHHHQAGTLDRLIAAKVKYVTLNTGNVVASTGHFSVYAVGYKPAPAFADIVNHWAKADIDFVASRGLLAGTGDAIFTPDGAMAVNTKIDGYEIGLDGVRVEDN